MQPLPPPRTRSTPNAAGTRDSARRENRYTPRVAPDSSAGPSVAQPTSAPSGPRKRKHRGGKKRKNRRQSFAAPPSDISALQSNADSAMNPDPLAAAPSTSPPPFYSIRTGNNSNDSLDSAALLDHRDQPMMRARRESRLTPGPYGSSQRGEFSGVPSLARSRSGTQRRRLRSIDVASTEHNSELEPEDPSEQTPLMATALQHRSPTEQRGYAPYNAHPKSRASSKSSGRRKYGTSQSYQDYEPDYDINNPPSMPASPQQQPFDNTDFLSRSPTTKRNPPKDTLIDIDELDDDEDDDDGNNDNSESYHRDSLVRHQALHLAVEGDVCFPGEVESEMAFEDYEQLQAAAGAQRRRKRREWPQLWVLEEWSQQEKEQRNEIPGAKKISEPVLIEGRLRPKKHAWHRLDEDVPYRFTYFNEEFESTIHSQTISKLVQPGGTFRELFIPEPPVLEDSSDSSEDEVEEKRSGNGPLSPKPNSSKDIHASAARLESVRTENGRTHSRTPSIQVSGHNSGDHTPPRPQRAPKPKRFGPRPTFWLDVMSPTEQEMRVLCKSFGIHALTSEDIMMQEAREKVELFRHYYFINYRTFEQDRNSEDYLEPINMYVIVFRQGILTFHFSQIPHPANVRRRIRQLSDYLILSSDWISYAIIDDITDVYQPLIHNIEQEVDDIDELILRAFSNTTELVEDSDGELANEKASDAGGKEKEKGPSGIDMLRRVGECRKKVMALYRLLGNKADVIKGFAKRCNEQWEVAPKSEIGLYLGDIQDHILTMTSNLSHYETLLSRAHSNYLAQVSIRMNERQEQTSDVLGKLTVIGTIVLPMNIITGMWGMNVNVPGQHIDNLHWFWGITAGLFCFGVFCYLACKKIYKIV